MISANSPLNSLPPAEVERLLALGAVSLVHSQKAIPDWRAKARPEQIPPEGDWSTWYIKGGRGSGKTWTGANNLAELAQQTVGTWGVVAPSFGEARDKCIEGESGLLAALGTNRVEVARRGSRLVDYYNRSLGELLLRNGSLIVFDGADDGAPSIQGYNLNGCWADEVGLWKRWLMAWRESIGFAVRKAPAKIIATGTPKRGHGLVKMLVADPLVRKTHMRTRDNAANLSPERLAELEAAYAGTTLGRQELGGEMLEDSEGALWKRALIIHANGKMPRMIDASTGELVPAMQRIVVGVDPAVSSNADSDETGIVVTGLGVDGKGYVLADRSGTYTPRGWAMAIANAFAEFHADRIVAEVNNGGDLVEVNVRTVNANLPITKVHASQGKRTRAEPILGLYEQGRVMHADPMTELEDQMCNWNPAEDKDSPDRLDALVWALTDLMLADPWGAYRADVSASRPM